MAGRLAPALALAVLPLAVGLSAASTTVPRCHATDLRVYLTNAGAAVGTITMDVAFRNHSGHACIVYGYAGFGLEDAHHRATPSRVTWGSTVARRDPGRHRVVLRPGRAAFANLSFSDVPFENERCSRSAWLEVTPPAERRYRLVPFGGFVCDHGHLTATALSRTRTPHG
jgi:hypothetical protein